MILLIVIPLILITVTVFYRSFADHEDYEEKVKEELESMRSRR